MYGYIFPPVTSYQKFSIVLDPADFPPGADSIQLQFYSSSGIAPRSGAPLDPVVGSSLLIDGLSIVHGPTGIKKIAKENSAYTVYPNPATNVLNIKYTSQQGADATVTICDAKGSIV
ncbi:MAG: T9SS type A sorting domain-containing protein, partial [Flavipsychrobacter sp.]